MNHNRFFEGLTQMGFAPGQTNQEMINQIEQLSIESGYTPVEVEGEKPWGGYVRFHDNQAEDFLNEFFPNLSLEEAQLGNPEVELSPKILLAAPNQRLSWQYHDRRAERWHFLTNGQYSVGQTDELQPAQDAAPGFELQIAQGERHRLIGGQAVTLVAEIWQHTVPGHPSDEADIVRVQDDYRR